MFKLKTKYINLGNQFHCKKYNQKIHYVEYYNGKWKHKFCWYFDPFPEIMFTAFILLIKLFTIKSEYNKVFNQRKKYQSKLFYMNDTLFDHKIIVNIKSSFIYCLNNWIITA